MKLYSEIFYAAEAKLLLSDEATVARMLQVEAALAKAQADHGLFPASHAVEIAACCQLSLIDWEQLKASVKLGGNAAIPLVAQLTRLVRQRNEDAARFVHLGATSQDVVDTATVLQIKEFTLWTVGKITDIEKCLAQLTEKHRNTVMIGRTLLQQARPIPFGLKTAGWLESISRSGARIQEVQKRVLRVQLVGAVGSGNAFISTKIRQTFADELGLHMAHSWHTHRDNIAEFAAVLGILSGSLGKIATDVLLLMQTEIAEVLEGSAAGKGGSSTMPHKRNPVTCAAILANTHRIPFLVATIMAAMPQENERSAGRWHSEWEVLTEIMQLCAGAIEQTIELLQGLETDEKRMLQNLELTKGLIYAESVSLAIASEIGKAEAHALIEKACKMAVSEQKHLKEVLLSAEFPSSPPLTELQLDDLFKPEHALGNSFEIIDDILKKYEDQLQNRG